MPWWISAGVAIIAVAALTLWLLHARSDQKRFESTDLAAVRRMNWREFEEYLGYLFRSLGYQAEVTPPSGDFGVDVLVTQPNGTRIAVQAKHWRSDYVGVEHVLKTVGGALHYRCQQALVVTTSGFTEAAREAARTTGAELWGPKELEEAMERVRAQSGRQTAVPPRSIGLPVPKQAPKPQMAKPHGQPVKPTPQVATAKPNGPQCGSPMVARTARDHPIWLCSRFPGCKGYVLRSEGFGPSM